MEIIVLICLGTIMVLQFSENVNLRKRIKILEEAYEVMRKAYLQERNENK